MVASVTTNRSSRRYRDTADLLIMTPLCNIFLSAEIVLTAPGTGYP